MATRINSEGYFLDANGAIKDPNQKDHLVWKAKLAAAWSKGHKDALPVDQTIMVAENGDCQWTIAEDAGADPSETSYELNLQYKVNPDLIPVGGIVFVTQSTKYAHSDGPNAKDNTDIVANQTFLHTASESSEGDFTKVRADVSAYLDTIPPMDGTINPTIEQPGLHYQAVHNLLYFPSWGGPNDEGHYGRQLVAEEYLKKFPVTAAQGAPGMNRETAANELKVSLGLTTKTVKADGTVEYKDRTEQDFKNEIAAEEAKRGVPEEKRLKGAELDKAVSDKVDLQRDINQAYSHVKAT
jgi:hypothetical protein